MSDIVTECDVLLYHNPPLEALQNCAAVKVKTGEHPSTWTRGVTYGMKASNIELFWGDGNFAAHTKLISGEEISIQIALDLERRSGRDALFTWVCRRVKLPFYGVLREIQPGGNWSGEWRIYGPGGQHTFGSEEALAKRAGQYRLKRVDVCDFTLVPGIDKFDFDDRRRLQDGSLRVRAEVLACVARCLQEKA